MLNTKQEQLELHQGLDSYMPRSAVALTRKSPSRMCHRDAQIFTALTQLAAPVFTAINVLVDLLP